MVTLRAKDQAQLGSASAVAGSIRFLISSISAIIYTVVLTNRLAKAIPAFVIPAVVNAGLPASSASDFIAAFSIGPSAFEKIPNITPNIIAVGTVAYKEGNASAYRTVFLTTIAFTGIAIIATLFLPNIDHLLTGKVATTLHERNKEDVVGAKHTEWSIFG
jgi:hypothetical protein